MAEWTAQEAEEYKRAFGDYPTGYKPKAVEMPSGLTALERAAWRQANRKGGGIVPDSTYGAKGTGLALAHDDSVSLGQITKPEKKLKPGEILNDISDQVTLNFALGRPTRNDSAVVRNLAGLESYRSSLKPDKTAATTKGPLEYQQQISTIKKQLLERLGPDYDKELRGGVLSMQQLVEKVVAEGKDKSPEIRDLIQRYAMYSDSLGSWHRFRELGAKNPGEGFRLREELGEAIDNEEELARIGQEFNMTPNQLRELYNAIK